MPYITHTIEPWMPAGALKAKEDIAKIAESVGWQRLSIERYNDARFSAEIRHQKIHTFLDKVGKNDIVVHQFPTYMSQAFEQDFQRAIQQRGAKYVLLIHDFEPLRVSREHAWEWELAQCADLIIAHSQPMASTLQQHGVTTPTETIQLFDYLGPTPALNPIFKKEINYAGTWQKAPWLQHYQGPKLNLFGSRPKRWKDLVLPKSINWVGSFDPEEITTAFSSGFGLLWDSDYEDKFFQSYTKVNAPHKASLYLKAGLPLIAWSQSYLGDIVRANQLGMTIDDLSDLTKLVGVVRPADYLTFQENSRLFQKRISEGYFTKEVLEKVLHYFR